MCLDPFKNHTLIELKKSVAYKKVCIFLLKMENNIRRQNRKGEY